MFDLLDKLVDATIVINELGIVQFWNVAAENKFQFKKEEAIGKNIKFLMPSDIGQQHDGYIKRYLHSKQGTLLSGHPFIVLF